MTNYPADQVFTPPELPPYLKSVCQLEPVEGVPTDGELIGIFSVIRAAQKAAEIPGMGDPVLISRLSEHLFDVQMARYRNKHLATTFPENNTYTPPTLPVHVSIQLETITGAPSEEELIKAQDAIRIYHQFSNTRHTQRARESHARQISKTQVNETANQVASPTDEPSAGITNKASTRDSDIESGYISQESQDTIISEALERSNRLAEQANDLIERSNQLAERSNKIAERSNQLVEQSNHPIEQSIQFAQRFNELFEQLNHHMEQSTQLTKDSVKPVEKLGDTLGNINKVLVRIQHAIIRGHKGNTVHALDCLVNEKGETPVTSNVTGTYTFSDFARDPEPTLPVVIDGVSQNASMSDELLGHFLRFYGICSVVFKDEMSAELRAGYRDIARNRLSEYLSSCLG